MGRTRNDYIEEYIREVRSRIAEIKSLVAALKIEDDNHDTVAEILRLLYIIEGASKTLDMRNIETLIQKLENVFKGQVRGQNIISYKETDIPICFLSILLRTEQRRVTEFPVVIVSYLETSVALAVDSIERTENLIISPLPKILSGMSSLQGVTPDENYSLVLVLDIPWVIQEVRDFTYYDIRK